MISIFYFTAVPPEIFTTSGLMIVERNWLDIYSRFEKWSANKVPLFKGIYVTININFVKLNNQGFYFFALAT